jgi:hypothetical protein
LGLSAARAICSGSINSTASNVKNLVGLKVLSFG